MRLGVTLLGVDEVGEFGGVTNEEDGRVVENPVEVPLLRPDLDSEAWKSVSTRQSHIARSLHTTGVTGGVCRTELTTDGGETDRERRGLADFVEERRACQVADVVRDLKDTVSTGTLGMDDTLCTARSKAKSHIISTRKTCEKRANGTHRESARDRSGR